MAKGEACMFQCKDSGTDKCRHPPSTWRSWCQLPPYVRISQRHLGEYPDVEVDGVPINGVLEFKFEPPHQLTLVLEVGHLEAQQEPLRPGPRDACGNASEST